MAAISSGIALLREPLQHLDGSRDKSFWRCGCCNRIVRSFCHQQGHACKHECIDHERRSLDQVPTGLHGFDDMYRLLSSFHSVKDAFDCSRVKVLMRLADVVQECSENQQLDKEIREAQKQIRSRNTLSVT